jgi:hypothetical protein
MTAAMDQSRFDALAQSYGSDLGRWPADERAAAAQWLQGAAEAGALLAQQRALERQLEALPPAPPPSMDLRRRILAAAPTARPGALGLLAALWGDLGGLRRVGPALAASLALGIALTPVAAPLDPALLEGSEDYAALSDEDYEDLVP